MKHGRTHLSHKADGVGYLDSEVYHDDVRCGDAADTQTTIGNLVEAQVKLDRYFEGIQSDDSACGVIQESVADQGYHSNEVLKSSVELGIRACIPERQVGEM